MRYAIASIFLLASSYASATVQVLPAPTGDSATVARRIIRDNFPKCEHISSAVRQSDGGIRAICDGEMYRVFVVYNSDDHKLIEVSMNCSALTRMGIKGC